MERLNEFLVNHFDVRVFNSFKKKACYYSSMDHIEYLAVDAITVSDRVDDFLTVVWDKNFDHIVGFKLKGFKAAFERIKPLKLLNDENFNPIIAVLEHVFTQVGDEIFSGMDEQDERVHAYQDVKKFIIEENVDIDEGFAQAA